MDSDKNDVTYCPEDDEYRVYCEKCDKECIEQFYKNHLKSPPHTNNSYKRNQTKTLFKCDFFDIDMQNVSTIIYLKSLRCEKSLPEKYIINTPIFFEVDKI